MNPIPSLWDSDYLGMSAVFSGKRGVYLGDVATVFMPYAINRAIKTVIRVTVCDATVIANLVQRQ